MSERQLHFGTVLRAVLHCMHQEEALGIAVGFALVYKVNVLVVLKLLRNRDEFITRTRSDVDERLDPRPITPPPQLPLMLAAFRP